MSLNPDDVEKIAHLARLAIDPADVESYVADLSRIFGLVEQMNAADTGTVDPMAHPQDVVQRLRPDEVTETDQRETFQAVAPATEDGLYLVPRVID